MIHECAPDVVDGRSPIQKGLPEAHREEPFRKQSRRSFRHWSVASSSAVSGCVLERAPVLEASFDASLDPNSNISPTDGTINRRRGS